MTADRLEADVAVVGVGAFGSMTLWRGATRGLRMLGFEQHQPGHALGSSHGQSRVIRTAYFEDPAYVPLVREAFGLWRELAPASGAELLTMTGALMIGRPDSPIVAGTLASVRAHGLDHEVLDAEQLRARFPQHVVEDGTVGVHEAAAGALRPEAGVLAAVAAAQAAGARLITGQHVERIVDDGESVVVTAGGRDHRVGHVVVTAGPWLPDVLPGFRSKLRVERQVQVWFEPTDAAAYSPEAFPVFIRAAAPGHHLYGIPALDGRLIKIAVHHEGATTDPTTVDRLVSAPDLEPVEAFVRDCLSGVPPVAVHATVCLYTNTPDEHFVVGPVPGSPRVLVVGGSSGHGYKFAPVLGDIAVDLAAAGTTARPIALFDPARLITGAAHQG